MSTADEHRTKTMRRCFALINELGLDLTQTERRELAMMATWPPATEPVSWSLLSDVELSKIAEWLTGHKRITELLELRHPPAHVRRKTPKEIVAEVRAEAAAR